MTKVVASINADTADILASIDKRIEEFKDSCLTRDQAISRIKDIKRGKSTEHLNPHFEMTMDFDLGAIRELMAIFDIKEYEL